LREFLAHRERTTLPSDPIAPWLLGRSGEIQCVVALVALDWYQARVDEALAVAKLTRYLKDIHDGVAMHLDIGLPPCCRRGPALARPKVLVRARPALPSR
jgi:hypothetical protein